MQNLILVFFLFFSTNYLFAQNNTDTKRVRTTIDSTISNELVLIQEFEVMVPIDAVWNTYTTKEGWEAAFVPLAEVDLKINGLIQTNYNKAGTIGDSSTIVLHIINYVPKKFITLQAELNPHFPDFMKQDEKNLFNVVHFESLSPTCTKVISYGIGYRNTPKYLALLEFFISGNEMSYLNLISYLESGKPVKH